MLTNAVLPPDRENECCKTLGDYNRLYLKMDTLLLADFIQYFRKLCYDANSLDLLHSVSIASQSWVSALRQTDVVLELLVDPEMYKTIESGIRGGICQQSKRYVKANNELCPDYDSDSEKRYISYFDSNSLYGKSMTTFHPVDSFEWVAESSFGDIDFMNHPPDVSVGYIYVCDLEYPPEIHAKTRYFPLAPSKMVVEPEWLSDYQMRLIDDMHYKPARCEKLLLTCMNKQNYVVHYHLLAL